MLLYKDLLGTVSNSAYFKGHFDFDIVDTDETAFGGLINVLYAMALQKEAYPGDERPIALELEAAIFYEEANRLMLTGGFSAAIPFGALDRPANYLITSGASEAEWAWTLQGNLFLVF
jgi:hypothetical protein